jgi:predicted secreted Zn-dependent protease
MTEPEHAGLRWRKSTLSAQGDCVEVAADRERVYVRHSGVTNGSVLTFSYREWEAFIAGVLKHEFGLATWETD